MAVIENTITTEQVLEALSIEFVKHFNNDVNQLMQVLGIVSPEVVHAGTAMYQYNITGELGDPQPAEGDVVPLTTYTLTKEPIGEVEMDFYRKLTTAQAIQKAGIENAVNRQDRRMLTQVEDGLTSKFWNFLNNGTGYGTTPTGATINSLQAALAYSDAALADAMETNKDHSAGSIHIINRMDIADYLAKAEVSLQTLFGMTYLENFLGVENILVTSKVAKGTVFTIPYENLHMYAIDFATIGEAGLNYTTLDSGLIGVNHESTFERVGVITNVGCGMHLMAEVKDYIIKANIVAGA